MIAFHGKPEIKAEYLARIQAHEAADEIIHDAASNAARNKVLSLAASIAVEALKKAKTQGSKWLDILQ